MIDKKSEYLELPLSNEQNMLEDDCPRIVEAFKKVDAHAKTADDRLDGVEGRADSLESRASALETAQTSTEGTLQSHAASLSSLATEKADATALAGEVQARTEAVSSEASARAAAITAAVAAVTQAREEAMTAHDASLSAHDALVKRITVGSLSPVIGICCVEDGGGSGLWFNIDAYGQPVSPTRRYFDYHPTYNAIRRVLVDGQIMQEHSKFYYKGFQIASGPFAGRRGRLISPGPQDGFKPFPSFMLNGQEVDKWYCGTYASTDDGGTPKKLGSRPGKVPFVKVNFPTMQGYCQNRNVEGVTGFDMWNIYQASELQLLALIEAATPDTQAVYGRGRVDTSSANYVDATDVATASWRGHVGLWGNVWQMCAGLDVLPSGVVRLWKNNGTREFVETGFACPAYDGTNPAYITSLKSGSGEGFDWDDVFFPATTSTAASVATVPDGFWGRSGSAGNVLYLGAQWSYGVRAGLFACGLHFPASSADAAVGCRLAKV